MSDLELKKKIRDFNVRWAFKMIVREIVQGDCNFKKIYQLGEIIMKEKSKK